MLSLDFSERSLEVQRGVVMEEFKQRCLNQPYGDIGHLLRPLAYQTHPYQWPTIGKELSHIANATLEEVKAFFFRFYAPNNAILAVTGNISFEEAVALTEKWFGSIPRREVPQRNLPQEQEQAEAAVREELELLQQELVDEQELEKVKNKFESTQIFGNINYLNVATNLAWYELLGRAEDMEKEVDRYRSVTAEQLRAVAQSAFRKENGVILYYKKQQN